MKGKEKQSQTQQKNNKNQEVQYVITPRQSATLISSTIIGTGVLTLPRVAAKYAHETAWLSILLATLLSMIIVYVLTVLALRFPRETIIEYTKDILYVDKLPFIGPLLRYVLVLFFIAFWLGNAALAARIFGEMITTTLLFNTPIQLIIVSLLLVCIYIIYYEIEVLARFNEIIFPLIFIAAIAFIGLSLREADFINLMPFFAIELDGLFKSTFEIMFSFLGFGIVLIFTAYTQKKANLTSNMVGVAIPGFLYLLITIACITVFGYKELEHIKWSALELAKTAVIPGGILERPETIFIAVWVAAIFTTVANIYYAGCFSLAQILHFRKKNRVRIITALIFLPLLYFVATFPEDMKVVQEWLRYLNYTGVVIFLIIPLLLLIISLIRKKGGKSYK